MYLHDYGCTLKAYRYEVLQHIRLYGEMHRFIPAYVALAGAKIAEVEVSHHARQFGVSKYGISRTMRVLLDLLTLKFLASFGTKPAYAFGIPALFFFGLSSGISVFSLLRTLFAPGSASPRSSLLPAIITTSGFGCMSLLMGLLAEQQMRIYYESQHKNIYIVKEIVQQEPIPATV